MITVSYATLKFAPPLPPDALPRTPDGLINYRALATTLGLHKVHDSRGKLYVVAFDLLGPLTTYGPFQTKRQQRRFHRKKLRALNARGFKGFKKLGEFLASPKDAPDLIGVNHITTSTGRI